MLRAAPAGLLAVAAGDVRSAAGQHTSGPNNVQMWRAKVGASGDLDAATFGNLVPRTADIGYVRVPTDHFCPANERNRDVGYLIRFARFRAKTSSASTPVFFFFGGPDRSQNDLWFLLDGNGFYHKAMNALIDTVTETTDCVFIDQRGTAGCLYPRLPPLDLRAVLPLDRTVSLDERNEAYGLCQRRLIDYWSDAGVDLQTINARQSAADIDIVRKVFEYSKIRIVGESNGTYRAREYLRQFQSNVESALLFISHGYSKAPHPAHVRAGLLRIESAVAGDPEIGRFIPSLTDLLDDLTRKLNAKPVRVVINGEKTIPTRRIVLDGVDLASYFWGLFSYNKSIRGAPGRLWNISKGNYAHFASSVVGLRDFTGPDASNINSGYEAAFSGNAMPTKVGFAEYRRAAGESLYLNREIEPGSGSWPLTHDSQDPFTHTVPITYVQGEWDVRCPIEGLRPVDGREVTVVVNPRAGHQNVVTGVGSGDLWDVAMVGEFLRGNQIRPYQQFGSTFDAKYFH